MTHMPSTSNAPYDSFVTVYDVTEYGADRTGVVAANDAFERVLAAGSGETNYEIFIPPGTYLLERDGSNSWCLDLPGNVSVRGVAGKSILKQPTGMPGVSISFIRFDRQDEVTVRDVIFDGNWGNRCVEIEVGSDRATLSTSSSTIYVTSTDGFPSTGTLFVRPTAGLYKTVTYTGKTSTTFTGCTIPSGSVTLYRHNPVLYINSNQTGINHTTQGVNPSNHALMFRGCTNILVENCVFRDMFGDGVWLGTPADDDLQKPTVGARIIGCTFDMIARNAITIGGGRSDRVEIASCQFRWVHNSCIDAETNDLYGGVRDVFIHHNPEMRGWPTMYAGAFIIECVAGEARGFNEASAARGWRIENNAIYGTIHINGAKSLTVRSNRIEYDCQDPAYAYGPIYGVGFNDGATIEDNDIYDWGAKSSGSSGPHNGAIHLSAGFGSWLTQPATVRIRNNRIYARNDINGIWVNSQGGFATYGTAVNSATAGTATNVDALSLTHTGAGWTTNRYAGWTVNMGGMHALVISNTATALTLQPGNVTAEPYAWRHPLGAVAVTPTAGAYTLHSQSGFLEIEGNHIDCGADGNAAGGNGIYLFNDQAGGRISVRNNYIKNCGSASVNGYGVHVAGDAAVPLLFLELRGNRVWDDQAVATTSAAIRFASVVSLTSIVKLVMSDNGTAGGVSTVLSGVSAGKWLIADGDTEQWVGYGAPSHSAPKGSTYQRKDGVGTTDCFYINTSGSTTWTAK